MPNLTEAIIFAVLGSLGPALIWLWFWRKEDRKHPEPKLLITLSFIAGMVVVIPVIKLELWAVDLTNSRGVLIFIWAAIEEIGKLLAAYIIVLRRKDVDEPIDYVIYVIVAALGFAALENFLFIATPITNGLYLTGVINGNLRFMGATLLHTASSAIIGISMAFGFYRMKRWKISFLSIGIILGITLHALFNLTIIKFGGEKIMIISSVVWAIIIILLLLMEKVKRLHPINEIKK